MVSSNASVLTRRIASLVWPVVVILVAWELVVAVNGYTDLLLPRPGVVAMEILLHLDKYAGPTLTTIALAVPGALLGLALGSGLAILVWYSSVLDGLITPTTNVLQAIPVVAMLPVIGRLVGYNEITIIVVVMLLSFFPTFVLVLGRLRQPNGSTEDVFRVFGADRRTTLVRLLLPQAVPGLMAAIRMTAPFSIGAVILAQYLLAIGGLGQLITDSVVRSDTVAVWAIACITTFVAILVFALTKMLEDRVSTRFL
ncbi:NitT/TauT family transport system permease protein [Microbacterium proteolyticum]|uniref:NitT/TauT family transport system permease protein n=1 Tax=Microbacterium proteolyticum TaxID=1572644 RepID=A0A7W5CL33_9MICO|nr:ABC transporter permease subunit [Microbacterium proteolyticum]MBB3158884.1 NitT/TauT family transport system permease protein [Microbacterium proteolyticum]